MLNLRYKPSCCKQLPSSVDLNDLRDRIFVMQRQEKAAYACHDYIARRGKAKKESRTPRCTETDGVDAKCREKMAEWSFRIVDHFHGDRDIVAVSFSYLDRFLDRCKCSRAAFKLAAITTLYMATKVFSPKHLSIKSLADLSRGEFDAANIAEMESIILHSLEWRMHPPTSKSFIDHLINLLPRISDEIKRAIWLRAHFFSEISVLDYSLVCENPSSVALASILNAAEGFQHCHMMQESLGHFHRNVEQIAGIDCKEKARVRGRLWILYHQSEQFKLHDTMPVMPREHQRANCMVDEKADGDRSPVSVSYETKFFS